MAKLDVWFFDAIDAGTGMVVSKQKIDTEIEARKSRQDSDGRHCMRKSIATIAGLTAILSLGLMASANAGGGGASAPSKYNNAAQGQAHAQSTSYAITEFSSSSAKSSTPKR